LHSHAALFAQHVITDEEPDLKGVVDFVKKTPAPNQQLLARAIPEFKVRLPCRRIGLYPPGRGYVGGSQRSQAV
jgi:hypothetical protein